MKMQAPPPRRNLFEIDNARNLTRQELVTTFVPTQSFWRLLSAKNHIVLGARGSGKTALVKMLSHDHLSRLIEPRAKSIIEQQEFIGVYIPTKLEWVGGLKNKPWQSDSEKEEFFQWRLNLSSCVSLLHAIESCIRQYCGDEGKQARAERDLSSELAEDWLSQTNVTTIEALRRKLEDVEYHNNRMIAKSRVFGHKNYTTDLTMTAFGAELFAPLRRGITLTQRRLNLKDDCTWLICIDETEFLDESHHRILNSHMRAHSGNVFFKLTTMPYCHYTLETNSGASLDVGHDFEYAYIDSDPVYLEKDGLERNLIGTHFAKTLFHKRVIASGLFQETTWKRGIKVEDLLGRSELLDEKEANWTPESESFRLLEKYCSDETILRARKLLGTTRFKSEISRKIGGVLRLRDAYNQHRGNAEIDIYSGANLVIRCGDSNPRRIIRLFNALILMGKKGSPLPLPKKVQSRVVRKLSTSALVRVQSEPKCGRNLYSFLDHLGKYMQDYLHERPLTTDQVTSFRIKNDISEHEWELVQRAVELGLLYPSVNSNARDEMPVKEGTFHLAYILAPHFFLMPRRGQARQLGAFFPEESNNKPETGDWRQPNLFEQ